MNCKNQSAQKHRRASAATLVSLVVWLVAGAPQVAAEDYNSFSRMVRLTSTWQSNFYSDIIHANAAKGSFGELASAPRVTQQEVQNLCKPFPCGNEHMLGAAPAPSYPTAPVNRAAPPPAPRQYPITATDFKPPRGRIVPDEISRTNPGTAEEKALLRNLSNQFLDNFEKEARKNNIANSFAFLAGVSMQIVLRRDLTDAETDQLISGFNNSIAGTPQFASMSAQDKQVLNESSVITAGMMAFLNEQGKLNHDTKMQADARVMARAVVAYFFGVQVQ